MNNILIIDKYWKTIEIDLNDPDPLLRTNCAICTRELFPEWQNPRGTREIGEKAVCAICWKCSCYGADKKLRVQTVDQMKETHKAEQKEKVRERRKLYIPKKKREKAIQKRADALNKRPCGCSIKGRHKASCKMAGGYKIKGQKDD